MFEAGALSKNIDKSKVCPLLFGVDPTDIQGPLIQFQAAKFTKDEMKKVVKMMNNELGDHALATEVFENVFEMWWPKLNEKIESELTKSIKSNGKEIRQERDILEEILTLTRGISLAKERANERENGIHPEVIEDLIYSWSNIVSAVNQKDNIALVDFIDRLSQPIIYLINMSNLSRSKQREYISKFEESKIELDSIQIKAKNRFASKRDISDGSTAG